MTAASIDDTTGATPWVDPALAEGRSKLLLFGGLGCLGVATLVNVAPVFWLGLVVVTLAFGLNTVGKLLHYRTLPVAARDRLVLSLSWVLLAGTVVTLLATFALARYAGREPRFFWSLAVAGIGFGLLHMAAQSTLIPASVAKDEDE
ncbi:hypothetical protein [Natronomonas sp. EA1]|uniref:hypothetical protein n=1 Tax=Natronomonas sp. EA1 TaxID=3421655 RepID=UPI003EBD01FB